jgi:hypothetical protein
LFGNKDSPVDLDALAGSAGLEVKQAQVLVEAAYNKLKFYYGQGEVEQIQVWQATWGKANEALRKALLADKDIQSARGDSIPRDQARQEWVKVLETLRVMRRSVWNRVKAQLPDIPPDLELKIRTAVAAEMEKEEKVLRTLNELKEPADADARLIAA